MVNIQRVKMLFKALIFQFKFIRLAICCLRVWISEFRENRSAKTYQKRMESGFVITFNSIKPLYTALSLLLLTWKKTSVSLKYRILTFRNSFSGGRLLVKISLSTSGGRRVSRSRDSVTESYACAM